MVYPLDAVVQQRQRDLRVERVELWVVVAVVVVVK